MKKENLFFNKEKFQKQLDEKQKELNELTKTLSDKELAIEGKKQEIEKYTDARYEAQEMVSNAEVSIESLEKRQKQVTSEINNRRLCRN